MRRAISLLIVIGVTALYEIPVIQEQSGRGRLLGLAGALCAGALGFVLVLFLRGRLFDPNAKPVQPRAWQWALVGGLSTIAATSVPQGAWEPPIGGLIMGVILGVVWLNPALRR
jgi:membrane associated rhomboid family serine protease